MQNWQVHEKLHVLPLIKLLLLGITLLFLAHCSPRIKNVTLPLDPPDEFADSGREPTPDKWWTVFEDAELDSLVLQALSANFSLLSARQRLLAAQAVVRRESAALFPGLEGFFGGEIRQPELPQDDALQLGLSAQYEVDWLGRMRSQVDAEQYRASATRADVQAAALSLSAEVVRTWYRLIEAQNQLDLLNEQIDTNAQVLQLLRTRFGSGQIRGVDILRQKQLLESTREQKIVAESQHRVLQHRFAILLGKPPQTTINITTLELPDLPPLPQTGLPMELVRRRPDVQRSFNNLLAADRDLAAAISNQYPRLNLSASISASGDNADQLFQDWMRSFAGDLLAPIFYGGQLRAEVDRAEAVKHQRLYEYGEATLVAFREVEDALIREKKQMQRYRSLQEQVGLARQAYDQLRLQYFNGMSNYLDVLTALTDEQRLRRDALAARLLLLEYRIALYRALAGGFGEEMPGAN